MDFPHLSNYVLTSLNSTRFKKLDWHRDRRPSKSSPTSTARMPNQTDCLSERLKPLAPVMVTANEPAKDEQRRVRQSGPRLILTGHVRLLVGTWIVEKVTSGALPHFERYKPCQQRSWIELTDDAFDVTNAACNWVQGYYIAKAGRSQRDETEIDDRVGKRQIISESHAFE